MGIQLTSYPKTKAAQQKFTEAAPGDVVWLTGGYDFFDSRLNSFGRRAKVVSLNFASNGKGHILVKDFISDASIAAHYIITKRNILDELQKIETLEDKAEFLKKFDLEVGDLDEAPAVKLKEKEKSSYASWTKTQLIARIKELELQTPGNK